MILFRAVAIFASSISMFGKSCPQTDRQDFNSSTESTISTSLIHNVASDGKSEQVVTWFLNLIFQHQERLWRREFVEMQLRYLLSLLSNQRVLRNMHGYWRTHSRRPSRKCRHWTCFARHLLRKCSWNWFCLSLCVSCATLFFDMAFVMCEVHNEDSKWTRQTSWNERHASKERACYLIQLRNVIMCMFRKILNSVCEWSHSYEESEWSLRTSLMRLFCCPWRYDAGRSLREMCRLCSPCGPKCCASRRSPDGAMSHDGNFDQLVASQEFFVGWRTHRACAPSSIDRSMVVLRNPQTSAQLFGIDPGPHSGVGPGGVGEAQSVKASSIVLMLFLLRHRHAVPLKSPATKSICWEIMPARIVRMSFLAMPFFLA